MGHQRGRWLKIGDIFFASTRGSFFVISYTLLALVNLLPPTSMGQCGDVDRCPNNTHLVLLFLRITFEFFNSQFSITVGTASPYWHYNRVAQDV